MTINNGGRNLALIKTNKLKPRKLSLILEAEKNNLGQNHLAVGLK